MAKPSEPPGFKYANNVYGNYSHQSRDGTYWFEWTPFTPAVRAWQSAERYLRTARDALVEAQQIYGFAIPGLEAEYREFKEVLKILTRHVDERAREAWRVTEALDAANTSYAKVNEASPKEYKKLVGVIDNALAARGRPPSGRDMFGNPIPRN
jgi:hypothetical protein